MTDLRLAARRLLATPLFTIFAVLSLAIGVGVTTAVYSVVDSIFLRDAGARDPDRLVFVVVPVRRTTVSPARYHSRTSRICAPRRPPSAACRRRRRSLPPSPRPRPRSFLPRKPSTVRTSRRWASPRRSAGSSSRLTMRMRHAVVVLSHALWRTRFAANPAVVGQTIRISRTALRSDRRRRGVVRRRERRFAGHEALDPAGRRSRCRGSLRRFPPRDRRRLMVFGRLAPSVTVAAASAELIAIAASLDAAFPPRTPSGQPRATERPWKAENAGGDRR